MRSITPDTVLSEAEKQVIGADLNSADDAYYSGKPPLMSDAEYDWRARATGHQSFVTAELPSLNNAIREEDFTDWVLSIPSGDRIFHVELKIDGCSLLVQFQDGEPVAARTRKLSVPIDRLAIPTRADGFTGHWRGEAWHSRGRAYAAGRLRARGNDSFIRWTPFAACAEEQQLWPARHRNPLCVTSGDTGEILKLWDLWQGGYFDSDAPGGPWPPNDGLVVSVADPAARKRIGHTSRAPLFSIALK